jgi:hypothetical protein
MHRQDRSDDVTEVGVEEDDPDNIVQRLTDKKSSRDIGHG